MFSFFVFPEILVTLIFGGYLLSGSLLVCYIHKRDFMSLLLHPFRAIMSRVKSMRFLLAAPKMIQEGYDKAQGDTFVVDSPDIRYHLVSSPRLIDEIDRAPNEVLSLQAAAKVLLRPEQSMHNFGWFEKRGTDGTPLPKTVRTLLRNDLPSILPKTRIANSQIMDKLLSGPGEQPNIAAVIRECVVCTNAIAFFGEELAKNKKFMKAADDFIDKTVYIAESVRILPGFLSGPVVKLMQAYFSSQHIMFDALEAVTQQRIDERRIAVDQGQTAPHHKDCIQYIMKQSLNFKASQCERTAPWSAGRIVHELMALWFGAVHTMAMATTFAVRDVCTHTEYIEPLRKEIESSAYTKWEATGQGLPLLDSFLKESTRMNPLDNVSTRRKALKPITLSDGTHVKRGEWLATPLAPMLRDSNNWVQPLKFHGFRHVDAQHLACLVGEHQFANPEPEKAALLTDVSKWQTWGTGRMACPGRFYAAAGIKQIFSLLLSRFDCELIDTCAPSKYSWRTCNVPRSDMAIVVRPRKE